MVWFKLLYSGFETCFGWDPPVPKVLGADSKHASQIQMLRHFAKKGGNKNNVLISD